MRNRRWIVVVMVVALVAAACGDRGDGGGTGDGTTATSAATGAPGNGDFGDLEGVCGPAQGEIGPVADDPAETQGIGAETIKVGTVSDPGFAGLPGLNQEIFDAGEAFVSWCNEAGGINGRQIELTEYDAAVTNYQPQLEAACDREFGIVGSGAVQDNLWPTIGAACGLIDVAGFSVTPEKGGLAGRDSLEDRTIQPLPNPADRLQVGAAALLADQFPDAIGAGFIVYADLPTLATQADKERQGYGQVGMDFGDDAVYNIGGESNWTPFATAVKDSGATVLRFVGTSDNLVLLQQALQEVGYEPDLTFQGTNFYEQAYIDAAAGSAEGTFIESVFNPFEEADQHPATRQYIDLVEAQGGKVALLGAQSMSGWLLFATAARDCDIAGTLTRTCVLETAGEVTEWTGGGLHAPTSPGTNEGSECQMVLQVQGDEFVRHAPAEGFACDPEYVVEVEPGTS
jgi:ABC-type branched-subunit amino acid transport system substrate-binding protein